MELVTINKEKVKPLNVPKVDLDKIKGKELFPNIYGNIFILGKKASGKTCTIAKILDKCANKRSKVYFFVSTIDKDASYEEILKALDRRKIPYEKYTEIIELKAEMKKKVVVNHLQDVLDSMAPKKPPEPPKKQPDVLPKPKLFLKGADNPGIEALEAPPPKKEVPPKKVAPEAIFIFDDMSNQLREPAVAFLMKRNRHFKSKVIISSQYLNDLEPASIQQLDYALVFPGVPDDKIEEFRKKLDIAMVPEHFLDLYKVVTAEPYNFLYIDVRKDQYRKNFDQEIKLVLDGPAEKK